MLLTRVSTVVFFCFGLVFVWVGFFEPSHAYGISVPQPVIEPGPPAVKVQNPSPLECQGSPPKVIN